MCTSRKIYCDILNQDNPYANTSKGADISMKFICRTNSVHVCKLDVHGSVHHSIIHIENPTRWNSVSKFYFIFIWSSTHFGQHTVHHQEPKTALAASAFAFSMYAEPEAASAVLGSWWWAVCHPKHVELHINMK
jgi:hypothetical protein